MLIGVCIGVVALVIVLRCLRSVRRYLYVLLCTTPVLTPGDCRRFCLTTANNISQLLSKMPQIIYHYTHKFHLSTLAVKKLINDFSGPCLILRFLPLVFSSYCFYPETALLLLESDLQQSTLVQLLEQNVLHLQSSTVC